MNQNTHLNQVLAALFLSFSNPLFIFNYLIFCRSNNRRGKMGASLMSPPPPPTPPDSPKSKCVDDSCSLDTHPKAVPKGETKLKPCCACESLFAFVINIYVN